MIKFETVRLIEEDTVIGQGKDYSKLSIANTILLLQDTKFLVSLSASNCPLQFYGTMNTLLII